MRIVSRSGKTAARRTSRATSFCDANGTAVRRATYPMSHRRIRKNERHHLSRGAHCHCHVHFVAAWIAVTAMISETLVVEQTTPVSAAPAQTWSLQWTPIVVGALAAASISLILLTFAAALGLGVASTAPTWRDASVALWLLSGIYLVFQALISFGCGGYFAGRVRMPSPVPA